MTKKSYVRLNPDFPWIFYPTLPHSLQSCFWRQQYGILYNSHIIHSKLYFIYDYVFFPNWTFGSFLLLPIFKNPKIYCEVNHIISFYSPFWWDSYNKEDSITMFMKLSIYYRSSSFSTAILHFHPWLQYNRVFLLDYEVCLWRLSPSSVKWGNCVDNFEVLSHHGYSEMLSIKYPVH